MIPGDTITLRGVEYTAVLYEGNGDPCSVCSQIESTCGEAKDFCHGEKPFVLVPTRHANAMKLINL